MSTPKTISKNKLTLETLRKIPKAELHCHLDGSVRVATIIDEAKKQNVELPSMDEKELSKLVTVDENCKSLVEYLRGFDITLKIMQQKQAISRIMEELAEDAYNDGIRYIEIRFSPILHTQKGLSLSSVMEAVIAGKEAAELKYKVVVRIIVCAMRHLKSSVSRKLAETAWRYRNSGVVGFDLAGPENGFSSKLHKEAFELIHEKLFSVTIHSGEAANWDSVQDSIRFCGAQRIGHGTRMIQNKNLCQYVANHRIPIEICVTSNIHTKAISTWKEHPLRQYLDMGLVVVPCTDNRTVSGITLSEEYFRIQNIFDFSIKEIYRMVDNGFRSAFERSQLKGALRDEALKQFIAVLHEDGYHEFVKQIVPSSPYRTLTFVPEFEKLNQSDNFKYYNEKLLDSKKLKNLIEEMPKSDINSNLIGSISIETLIKCYNILVKKYPNHFKMNFQLLGYTDFKTDDLKKLILIEKKSRNKINKVVQLMSLFVQDKETIEQGLEDVVLQAISENVNYLELSISPHLHTKCGLSYDNVLDIIFEKKESLYKDERVKDKIKISFNIMVNNMCDGYQITKEMALLTVKNKHRITGFCYSGLGFDVEPNSPLIPIFDFLKHNEIAVMCVCAFKNPSSVVPAIKDFGATRLSGCFSIYKDPLVMEYLAKRMIPVEVSYTDTYKLFTKKAQFFAGSAARLYMDQGIKIVPVTTNQTLSNTSRNEHLLKMAKEAKMSVQEIVHTIASSYKSSFMNYLEKKELCAKSEEKCLNLCKKYLL